MYKNTDRLYNNIPTKQRDESRCLKYCNINKFTILIMYWLEVVLFLIIKKYRYNYMSVLYYLKYMILLMEMVIIPGFRKFYNFTSDNIDVINDGLIIKKR